MDKLLRASECARRFDCTAATVRRWIISGKLPAVVTPGGTYRVREEDVEKLLHPTVIREAKP